MNPTEPFQVRAERMLEITFRGLHHCPKIHKIPYKIIGNEYWAVNYSGDLSTYDYDLLTRLVVAAHDNCIRVSICSSGPRLVKIRLDNRTKRVGMFHEQHPTIEQAVDAVRKGLPCGQFNKTPVVTGV